MQLLRATIQAPDRIALTFDRPPDQFSPSHVTFSPSVRVLQWDALEHLIVLHTEPLDLRKCHTVIVRHAGVLPVLPDGMFARMTDEMPLGCTSVANRLVFRVFAPRAVSVDLVLSHTLDDTIGTSYAMTPAPQGIWEVSLEQDPHHTYYTYRISGATGCGMGFDADGTVADPWARMVISRNTWQQEARGLIPDNVPYDWQGDAPVRVHPRDLVIYEMHVRDMTRHPSSGADSTIAGSYAALARTDLRGGIAHLRALGVNAVELLPCQHFAALEPPYHEHTDEGVYNTWNAYARNHWGYMTSYFFAPEPRYASTAEHTPGAWNDTGGRHADEFRDMIRTFHREGIAVIMDVVYNHASQYDRQPLRRLDTAYFFHLDAHGRLTSASGCGNDLHTARPLARRLIVESIEHWMRDYHIDGFRFDLAAMIDPDTMEAVCAAARAINPDVILIAEPWGGGRHDITSFASLGMGSWNDIFRNGVKGSHPRTAQGYAFGSWGASSSEDFGLWVLGSPPTKGGPFVDGGWPVNYLEAHDGYTLGDFIRIAVGTAHEHIPVHDSDAITIASEQENRVHRFAAFMLFISQGAVMLHAGQEFARAKVIAPGPHPDTNPGVLDHNSYEKDDATNWINYDHVDRNAELFSWYVAMIRIRAGLPQLRHAHHGRYRFLSPGVALASGFVIAGQGGEAPVAVLVNANSGEHVRYDIGEASWRLIVDGAFADLHSTRRMQTAHIDVPPATCMVLVADDDLAMENEGN